MRLDHLVGAVRAKAERVRRVPGLVLGKAVDHRPLVHPEAAEVRRTAGGGDQQRVDAVDQVAAGDDVLARHGQPGAGQCHAVPRRPAPELGRAERVVGEQEVVDRVLHALAADGPGGRRPVRRPAPRGRRRGRARPPRRGRRARVRGPPPAPTKDRSVTVAGRCARCGGFEARPWTASHLSHRSAAPRWLRCEGALAPEPRSLVRRGWDRPPGLGRGRPRTSATGARPHGG